MAIEFPIFADSLVSQTIVERMRETKQYREIAYDLYAFVISTKRFATDSAVSLTESFTLSGWLESNGQAMTHR